MKKGTEEFGIEPPFDYWWGGKGQVNEAKFPVTTGFISIKFNHKDCS
jgi:hypothetical protein